MPTTYAHWFFGDIASKTLKPELIKLINENRAIFDYGVHGPDIFFYYNCLKSNDINKYGTDLHYIPFAKTLAVMKKAYANIRDKKAAMAYLLGFTCHFALDSYCHSFVEKISKNTPYSHSKIEILYDKHLMEKQGLDPFKNSANGTLKPSRKIAATIAGLFPQYDEKTIFRTISDQRLYVSILKDSSRLKRLLLLKGMDLIKANKYKDMVMGNEYLPDTEPLFMRFDKLFAKAIEHYPILANSMIAYMNKDKELDPYFHKYDFGHRKDYEMIPLLDMKEEKTYKVEFQK